MCNLYIETHFFIFSSFTFFTEKTTKNRCKTASGKKGRKTRPEDPPETRFGTQNGFKSTSEAQKSPKCSIKNRVGTSFASRTVQGSLRDRSRGGHILLDTAGEIHPACKGESPSHLDSKGFSWVGVSPPPFGDFLVVFCIFFGMFWLIFALLVSWKLPKSL